MPFSLADETFTRLTDVRFEPGKFLSPIEGYEKVQLVSLEQAIQPLLSIVSDIDRRAFIAHQRCQNPADNLTIDESAAIFLYTMEWPNCVYSLLNETLTKEDRNQLLPWFSYLKLLLTALFKLPSIRCTVWRGVKGLDLTTKYPKNENTVWWRFSSSTTVVEVLKSENFLGQHGLRTMFNIECLNGKVIKNHSNYQEENEVLLLPGTQFQVISHLDAGNGLQIIQMKELENPRYLMLEPPFRVVRSQYITSSTLVAASSAVPSVSATSVAQPTAATVQSSRNNDGSMPHYTPFASSLEDIDVDETAHEIRTRFIQASKGDFLGAFKWGK
ncbi:unnamed protein product [Rotaria sp. Silwood2]|nr:unnamed protein product [Rotaria sp. Silwood2]CAF2962942.1 unnamed protein product [Rotaria sp. Silwood2]CAF3320202.1 unnamed protein product [Rotaria sp. Silwood2]CAF4222549.1 unnamed protein product [Rotaria sp. Silwood2]CAF4270495.1 unnamed protein product [Rotaria sp. Silwood2]